MTVKELAEKLKDLPQDAEVWFTEGTFDQNFQPVEGVQQQDIEATKWDFAGRVVLLLPY